MYDTIIVGTGPAGFSAAMNLKIHNKSFLWFGNKDMSSKVSKAEKIRNYPGLPEITGQELQAHFLQHAENMDIDISDKMVTMIMKNADSYMVLADNELYEAQTVLFATGVMTAKTLDGEEEFLGRGISYCATCDGTLYKGKKIAVICNDERFEHEVEYLSELAEHITYFPQYRDCRFSAANVSVSGDRPVRVEGENRAERLVLQSGEVLPADGIFIIRNAIAPDTLLKELETKDGHIVVNRDMETNLEGCFAAGDCTGRPYQYTKAVGEGNVAAHSIIKYLAAKNDRKENKSGK
mgnify:FL=1